MKSVKSSKEERKLRKTTTVKIREAAKQKPNCYIYCCAPADNNTWRCSIRTDNYCRDMKHLNRLIRLAKKDFPKLKRKNIEVVVFNGRTGYGQEEPTRGMTGINFTASETPPKTYYRVESLSYIY